jgi:hypothetical protein
MTPTLARHKQTDFEMPSAYTFANLEGTERIDLGNVHIRDEGLLNLAVALKTNTSVTSINLYSNHFEDKGAPALADALKMNTTVTSISLHWNRIGAKGVSALADALTVNTSLTSLDVGYNSYGDKGAVALADALKVKTALTNLNISKSGIGKKGASALADALKGNTSVTSINMERNWGFESEWGLSVYQSLARNRTLRSLFLFDARQMLLSRLCTDECDVVWSYFADEDGGKRRHTMTRSIGRLDGLELPDADVETLRATHATVVEERRLRAVDVMRRLAAGDNGQASRFFALFNDFESSMYLYINITLKPET